MDWMGQAALFLEPTAVGKTEHEQNSVWPTCASGCAPRLEMEFPQMFRVDRVGLTANIAAMHAACTAR